MIQKNGALESSCYVQDGLQREAGRGGNVMVRGASEASPFMSGQLDSPALPELVQMFASGGHAVRIDLISSDGDHGTVTIANYVVEECRFGSLLGEDAFYALCGIAGRFTVTRTDPERHRRAAVHRGWQELLIEAARKQDETSDPRLSVPPTPPSRPALRVVEDWFPAESIASPQPIVTAQHNNAALRIQESRSEPQEEDRFSELFAKATKAYLLRDLDTAAELFAECQLLRPEDRRVRTNLKRLQEKQKAKEKG